MEKSFLSIYYTQRIKHPFSADFSNGTISLDVSKLKGGALKNLQELSVTIIDTGFTGNDDLLIEARFEFSLRRENEEYKHFLERKEKWVPLGAVNDPTTQYSKIIQLTKEVTLLTTNLIKFIGWRKGLTVSQTSLQKIASSWRWEMDGVSGNDRSDDSIEWVVDGDFYATTEGKINLLQKDFDDLYDLYNHQSAIPLHQELLFEVNRLILEGYERSAYLMMYVLFEVATKKLVSAKRPQTDWIMDNLPSPDLHKMYSLYINKEIAPILPENELDDLRNITTIRNKLAHSGASFKKETLEKHFGLIREWVRSIDYELGYKWVNDYSNVRYKWQQFNE